MHNVTVFHLLSLRPSRGLILFKNKTLTMFSQIYSKYAQMTVRDALNSALDEEMSADPKVFLMGEEVRENEHEPICILYDI